MKNSIQDQLKKAGTLIKGHKIIFTLVVLVVASVGYYGYSKVFAQKTPVRYVLGQVEKGTLISSISGSGQVSATNQLDIKPKVSGIVTSINVQAGQEVKAGAIIAQIDSRDALQNVRDAQADLTSAKISLEKTKTSTAQSTEDVQENLTKSYEDGYTALTDAFINYSKIIDDIDDIFYSKIHSPYMDQENIRTKISYSAVEEKNNVGVQFDTIKNTFEDVSKKYNSLSVSSKPEDIESVLSTTYSFSKQLADVVKNTYSLVTYLEKRFDTISPELTQDKETLNGYISTVNGKVASLYSLQGTIKDTKNALASANQTYTQLSGSTDPLDVQDAKLTVTQRQNAYQKALNTLSDYTVRASFDGVVASSVVKKGDTASSGTTLATIISKQQVATISLNELDVAKVKVGQKATLTFDAVDDLSISGQVIEIDSLGTVSQGVVSYTVKIGFDTQDDRIKPGMSVTTSIITEVKPNVLLVPSSAIKTNATGSYVEVLDTVPTGQTSQAGVTSDTAPRQVSVEVGSTNDTQTEIISGVSEGDQIVTRTITASTQTTPRTTTGTGVLGVPTGGAGRAQTGGGNFNTSLKR